MAQETDKTDSTDQDSAADTISDADAEALALQAMAEAGLADRPEVPELPDFSGMLSAAAQGSIDILSDVELDVKVELGRAEMEVQQVLSLAAGSVVELNKLAGDPVDILVNEQLVARGEVLVINDNFCVRINEIVRGVSELQPFMDESKEKTAE
ncbi:MAG: flagellar motor switch protein FliN [Sedimentisphaerales bacterium]|nr:flagellar motor switch protein FliN [Sedimentisphaerales bacterium]MBN2843621.1 flagellar motor switch protein FliN [Sedimentisphaerales bacterium]